MREIESLHVYYILYRVNVVVFIILLGRSQQTSLLQGILGEI